MRKIAINLHAKKGLDTAAYIGKMRELGFDALFTGVPTPTDLPVIVDALAKNGMSYEMIHAPFEHINDIWYEGEQGESMLGELMHAVDCAQLGGCPTVVVHLSSGTTPPDLTDVGRARFERLVEHAAQKKVRIAFENQRKLANITWALERFCDPATVGFCWDCGHEGCFTPDREFMPLFGDRLICTHIHDNPCLPDEDLHMIPFDASLDFDRVARQLRESGYAGTLTLEVFAQNSKVYDGMSCEAFLEKAAAAIKRLRSMIDRE